MLQILPTDCVWTAETPTLPIMSLPSPLSQPPSKVDPITSVQDSIDSLALSLFEALRGIRDAVAPQSLTTPSSTSLPPQREEYVTFENATRDWKNILPEDGLKIPMDYFSRAYDWVEPDYYAFLLAYLSGEKPAKELAQTFHDMMESKESCNGRKDALGETCSSKETLLSEVKLGDVGYKFRKQFDAGWFEGRVLEIRPLAEGAKDRRVVYSDGDMEDLSMNDLQELAQLETTHSKKKPRLSIKLKLNKSTSNTSGTDSNANSQGTSKNELGFLAKIPRTEQEYLQLLHESELERDTQMAQLLAQNILAKSDKVDSLVAKLPGMFRTRQMQLDLIEKLIQKNQEVERQLEESFEVASKWREEVRKELEKHTCAALGLIG